MLGRARSIRDLKVGYKDKVFKNRSRKGKEVSAFLSIDGLAGPLGVHLDSY